MQSAVAASDTAAATRPARTIHNPVIRDVVTFLETSEETGGRRTLLELRLAPGGGNEPHVHRRFAETFEVVEGTLRVHLGRAHRDLAPGQALTVPIGQVHSFSNPSASPVMVRVELTPGFAGFEQALHVVYGLARDGLTDRRGMPRNPLHLALLIVLSDTVPAGMARVLAPVAGWLARVARRRGIEAELLARYYR